MALQYKLFLVAIYQGLFLEKKQRMDKKYTNIYFSSNTQEKTALVIDALFPIINTLGYVFQLRFK